MAGLALLYDQADDERKLKARIEEIAAPLEPLAVHVFGSRAGEQYVDSSDWDLAFVSPAFDGVPFLRRGADIAWDLARAGAWPIDLLCYTPEEFERKKTEPTGMGAALGTARTLRSPRK